MDGTEARLAEWAGRIGRYGAMCEAAEGAGVLALRRDGTEMAALCARAAEAWRGLAEAAEAMAPVVRRMAFLEGRRDGNGGRFPTAGEAEAHERCAVLVRAFDGDAQWIVCRAAWIPECPSWRDRRDFYGDRLSRVVRDMPRVREILDGMVRRASRQ